MAKIVLILLILLNVRIAKAEELQIMAIEKESKIDTEMMLISHGDKLSLVKIKTNTNFLQLEGKVKELENKIIKLEGELEYLRELFMPNCEVNIIPEDIVGETRGSKFDY